MINAIEQSPYSRYSILHRAGPMTWEMALVPTVAALKLPMKGMAQSTDFPHGSWAQGQFCPLFRPQRLCAKPLPSIHLTRRTCTSSQILAAK